MSSLGFDENNNDYAMGVGMDRQLNPETIKRYDVKMTNFKIFILQNYPELVIDNEVTLGRVTADIIRLFFEYICEKRDELGAILEPRQFYGLEYVRSYRSALTDYFKKQQLELPNDIRTALNNYCRDIDSFFLYLIITK